MQTQPLRIMIGADTYPPDINGAAQFGHRLAEGMRDRGHEVHVMAACTSAGPSYEIEIDGITEHRLKSHHPPTHPYIRICYPWSMQAHVGRVLDRVKPDVVHVQCHYIVGRMLAAEATRRGIRLVSTNHFMPENLNPFLPFPDWFLRAWAAFSWKDMERVLGKAEYITTPTPIGARAMQEHGFRKPVVPVSNGIDSTAYERREGEVVQHPEHPVVLFVGRLAVEKNVDVLIRALACTTSEPAPHLEIAGTGEVEEHLRAVAQEHGVEGRVRFLGFVSDEELRAAYLRADVFCQPGTSELQSLVTLEAMSASTPVVLADALALPHLVEEGSNGYLFEPGDHLALAQRLDRVLAAPEEQRRAMGARSRELVARHAVTRTWDTFEQMYRGQFPHPPARQEAEGSPGRP